MSRYRQFLIFGFFLFVFCFTLKIVYERYASNRYQNVVIWDTEGYYIYLPAVFIYHGFEGIPARTIIPGTDNKYIREWPGSAKIYTKYTCGEAILVSPFWLTAHIIALINPRGNPPDGFSPTYIKSFLVAIAFYLTLGLFIAWRILRQYYSDAIVLLALTCIWMGTSFIQYTAFNPGNSHVFSFFLITLFIYQVPKVLEQLTFRSVSLFSITFGLLTLLRPTNGVVVLFPLLYNIRSIPDIRERIAYLWSGLKYWPVFIASVLLIFSPQFCYWRYVTGHWFIFSYVGEGFFYWKNPRVIQVLFDAQNGFFIYAPLMLLAIPGIALGWRERRLNMPVVFFLIAAATYTFGSWSCWWYGASYGHRAFIDFLPFFLFPLCCTLSWLFSHGRVVRYISLGAILFLLFLSFRLNSIYVFPWEGDNWGWKDVTAKYKEALYIKR